MSSKKTMAKEEQSSPIMLLPHDVIVDILARVSRFDYPILSLVCKHFQSIVTSPEIFTRRSLLGRTEHCLYVFLVDEDEPVWRKRLYILCPKANGEHRLVLIRSLPDMPTYISQTAMGSRIYVFSWSNKHHMITLSIDCGSHTVQPLPDVPVLMSPRMADIIKGRIYVIGYDNGWERVMVVFNTETQMWEPRMIRLDKEGNKCTDGCAVMGDKMYMRNLSKTLVYDPKESKWERDEMMNLHKWKNACVVDDVLYFYNSCDFYDREGGLRAYDQKQRRWRVVKGLEALLPETTSSAWPHVVNYGGKLALFYLKRNEIWCEEISLETRQDGEIWGKVEWCERLVTGNFDFMKALDVVV
ncbi:hypothetical protein BRARA_C01533 [Brassica rapa]|uniref:F-box domain-containing protein n=3 Tax=Brassica TaxID=3705 RepID=A0A397ZV39_BRACM|nr:hypothetical protein BRARA_C01533 [Brassica rapa]CAF2122198.1 unnamed protein product [Brassica napus]CAG7880330.1 unnamed protein product [Brassica rapa]VDC79750.1 unnamed protein product [Brassica rapa]